MASSERKILTSKDIERATVRIAHEIIERHQGIQDIALVGIRTRGVFLAERIHKLIQKIEKVEVPLGTLDITLYRDDLEEIGPHAAVRETNLTFDVKGKIIVLIDDVLYTGRTIRAALDAIVDFGRPQAIQLAVLIDRGHRELPIKADYVGKNIPTSKDEQVVVKLNEKDGCDEVALVKKEKTS